MQLAAAPVRRSSEWVLQLINIVFLMLLYFLVNGTIAAPGAGHVEPPHAVLVAAGNPPGENAAYVDRNGNVLYRGESASLPHLAVRMRSQAASLDLAEGTLPPLIMVADRRLAAGRLIAMVDELRRLGIEDISLVTVRDETP